MTSYPRRELLDVGGKGDPTYEAGAGRGVAQGAQSTRVRGE